MKYEFPYEFELREYQKPLWRHIQNGGKRAIACWHRRGGKDLTLWNLMICEAWKRKGTYYYFLPTFAQGRKIIWDGMTIDGRKFTNYIPEKCIKNKTTTPMKIELINGSVIEIIGTDNYDSIRGTNPIGCVFSEFAYQNPMAWEVVRPILKANDGWAVFNSTPNGKNTFYDMFTMAKENDEWFCENLSILQTKMFDETDMQAERDEGMSEEMLQQEYYCSFDVGTLGSYYAKQINDAQKENRICAVPYEPAVLVDVFMDLGRNDSTTILYVQTIGKEIRIIEAYDHSGQPVSHYVREMNSKDYQYRHLYLPHDGFNKRMESGKSIAEQFKEAGFEIKRVPNAMINNGIQQLRKVFPRIWFDKEKCKELIRALENYHKEWDEKKKVFRDHPFHDWSSHYSDAARYMAIGLKEEQPEHDYGSSAMKFAEYESGIKRLEIGIPASEYKQYEKAAKDLILKS